jgi:hypothetical protein
MNEKYKLMNVQVNNSVKENIHVNKKRERNWVKKEEFIIKIYYSELVF